MGKLIQDRIKTIYNLQKTRTYHFPEGEKCHHCGSACVPEVPDAHVRERENPKLPAGGKSENWSWVEEALQWKCCWAV